MKQLVRSAILYTVSQTGVRAWGAELKEISASRVSVAEQKGSCRTGPHAVPSQRRPLPRESN